jgi:proton-translocating NADH-quinone oxidoreductase chain N
MSSVLFVALPLLFGFATPLLLRLGKNAVFYSAIAVQLFLLYLAASALLSGACYVESISIAPPLGISFALNSASLFFVALFSLLTTLFLLYYLSHRKSNAYDNETKFLILVSMLCASASGLVLSSDIFNIYVFFEIAGISAYILSAYQKTPSALEAGLKYLLTGAVASIFLLFGIVLIYLNIGSLNLAVIAQSFELLPFNLKLLISILLLIGFGFKVEIFPLNFWVPDIYQGTSSLINALFSSIVIKAYLFVFFHTLYLFLPHGDFLVFLLYLGAVSMLVAEIVGLRQTHLKRLFAYSSLGQAALIFSAFALQNVEAVQGALFIVLAHSLAKFIIFLALTSIEKQYHSLHIDILKKVHAPLLRVVMSIAMLSLLGIPLFAGFIGKFLVLKVLAVEGMLPVLLIIIAASLLETLYYFKLMGYLFYRGDRGEILHVDLPQKLLFLLLTAALLLVGILPFILSGFFAEAAEVMLDATAYIRMILGA